MKTILGTLPELISSQTIASPIALQVEITSACNLRCTMCPLTNFQTASSKEKGHMKIATWHSVLEMAKTVQQVNLAGFGETLANPNCIKLLRELDQLGIPVALATNGTLVTEKLASQLAEIKSLNIINVSIDSLEKTTYQAVRGGNLDRALAGVRYLVTALKNHNKIIVSSIAMRENIESLKMFPEILSKLGVKRFFLQELVEYRSELTEARPINDINFIRAVEELRSDLKRLNIEFISSIPERLIETTKGKTSTENRYYSEIPSESEDTRKCTLPWEIPFIDKDGRVYPCCNAAAKNTAELGNISSQTLTQIWNGRHYEKFRDNLITGSNLPAICQACTSVSWGRHPFGEYSAAIDYDQSVFTKSKNLKLIVKNTGTATWTRNSMLRIGTTRPRDRNSHFFRIGWLSRNRIGTFSEQTVPPGAVASFHFPIRPQKFVNAENFQLVVDGKCWLPNTEFKIRPEGVMLFSFQQIFYTVGEAVFHFSAHNFGRAFTKNVFNRVYKYFVTV